MTDRLRKFTIEHVHEWNPCYEPERWLEHGREYTVLDIIDDARIPWEDRLWCVLRAELLSDKLMRLFAVWCARQVQHLMTDPRSIAALDVAEWFANGQATRDELAAAQDAARDAAWDAAWAAVWATARATAWAAAWATARATARAAAWAAARDAAWAAARDAAWAAQQVKLREMIIAGIETGDTK